MLVKKDSIKTEYVKLYSLIEEKIGIPIFQRFYDWGVKQVKQLEEDIIEAIDADEKEIYLLDYIYYYDGARMMLADGQQRLVTINLLIRAINDVIFDKSVDCERLQYFEIKYDNINNDLKYQPTMLKDPLAPFKKIYLEFVNFANENLDKLEKIVEIIKNNIYVYLKKCENADDAFVIFQQINTGGKPLSKDEIIKTALDQYSKAYNVPFDTKNIRKIKQMIISYYKFVKEDPGAEFDNIAIITFLKDYITKNEITFSDFVHKIDILKRLEKNPLHRVINYINRATLLDVLNVLSMKNIDVFDKRDYLDKVMIPLCLMSIVLSIKGGNPTVLKYLLNDIITMIKEDKTVNEIKLKIGKYIDEKSSSCKISFSDFKEYLGKNDKNQAIKKALMVIDVIFRNTSGTVNVDKINLEHIYPQKPHNDWVDYGWPTSDEDSAVLINNIGNYLLLFDEVNKKIKNKYLDVKVPDIKKIIKKDKLLQTEINTVDFDEFERRKGNYIKERQEKIADKLLELPFAQKLIISE